MRNLDRDNYTDQDDNYYGGGVTNESGASILDPEDFKKLKKRM
jgi:hypothetical protein